MLFNIIDEVAKESRKSQKEFILKKHESHVLQQALLFTYNVFWTFGVKKIDTVNIEGVDSILETWPVVEGLLSQLIRRELTGNSAKAAIRTLMENYPANEQEIIKRIINRDMEGGFSASTVNKVWPNLVPEFNVALAERYDKHPQLLTFDDTWLCSRKLDGCRCIAVIKNSRVKLYSRTGIEFTTLRAVGIELEQIYANIVEGYKKIATEFDDEIGDIVLDGEICLVDENGNEDFQGIMKQIKKKNHTIENPKYKVFDLLSLDDFLNKTSDTLLFDRLTGIRNHLEKNPSDFVEVLEQVFIDSEETFAEWNKKASDNGWEGLILRKNVGYEGKRTKNMLKVKKFFDAEYIVKDVITGDFNYSVAGQGQAKEEMMTAVTIEHKGCAVKVGSGFSINERKKFFSNPEEIIGKTITVQYFEETTNKEGGVSLRFPTLKVIHGVSRDT